MRGVLATAEEIRKALEEAGADRDGEGRFVIRGQVFSFMGAGDEFIIDGSVKFFVGGEERSLAELLVAGKRGTECYVIGG